MLVVDTRPYTYAIQDYVTGGGRGNQAISNLGRKWNACVVGGPDLFEHPDINDLVGWCSLIRCRLNPG